MIDYTLHKVEQPKAKEECSDEELIGPVDVLPVCGPPENKESDHNKHVGRAMEDAIP